MLPHPQKGACKHMVMEISTSDMKRVQLFEVIGRVDSTNAAELGSAMG